MRNITLKLLAAVGIASLAAGTAVSADSAAKPGTPAAPEASIPFIGHGTLRDWQADGRDGLWIQDTRGTWYYAKTLGTCIGLDTAWNIGLDARPAGTFDRFGSIILPGHMGRCMLTSLTKSPGPTKEQRKARPTKPKDAPAETPEGEPANKS